MKIHVGTTNPVKITAVKQALTLYPHLFPNATIQGIQVSVPEHGHPKTLLGTIEGAQDRAKQAFSDCTYSIGIEGGLMEVPHTTTGFMEIGVCAIYEGKRHILGISPAYEWPTKVTEMIVCGEADGSQAFKQLGLTQHEKLGAQPGGIIGVLTHGHMTREEFTKQSILMAVIQLEHKELYPTTTSSSSFSKK